MNAFVDIKIWSDLFAPAYNRKGYNSYTSYLLNDS